MGSTNAGDMADADNAADAYFERLILQCTCEQSCCFDGSLAISSSFFAMNEFDRQLQNDEFRINWLALEEVPSAKHGNQKAYLMKYICDKYFPLDAKFCQ
eukprot:IDg1658t1